MLELGRRGYNFVNLLSIPGRNNSSLYHNVKIGSRAHPVFYPMDINGEQPQH
jgi:hypothetical protein